jgi:hypothetical protein
VPLEPLHALTQSASAAPTTIADLLLTLDLSVDVLGNSAAGGGGAAFANV